MASISNTPDLPAKFGPRRSIIGAEELARKQTHRRFSNSSKGSTINDRGGGRRIENGFIFSPEMPFENFFFSVGKPF